MTGSTAAIVTVGTELTEGLRLDTNTAEIAAGIASTGLLLREAATVPDDADALAAALQRLTAEHDLVVVTGGLGPTHDDVTREAAAVALGIALVADPKLTALLEPMADRHTEPRAAEQLLSQALVLEGAEVIVPTSGTAPGQVVPTAAGLLALLPGPPHEMRPMLATVLVHFASDRAAPRSLGVVGMTESDAQIVAQRALEPHTGVGLTLLAAPGQVSIVLLDEGAGEQGVASAAESVASALGESCYSTDGSGLAESVVRAARSAGATLATAESCTGGMVASAITDVAGASDVFSGAVVAYANEAKQTVLRVPEELLSTHGAVSAQSARAMAEGARRSFGADLAVSTTGIAGPSGGTPDKPRGLVWFGVATPREVVTASRSFLGDRAGVRQRATLTALDLLRRELLR